jgi:hypothetical protein
LQLAVGTATIWKCSHMMAVRTCLTKHALYLLMAIAPGDAIVQGVEHAMEHTSVPGRGLSTMS